MFRPQLRGEQLRQVTDLSGSVTLSPLADDLLEPLASAVPDAAHPTSMVIPTSNMMAAHVLRATASALIRTITWGQRTDSIT